MKLIDKICFGMILLCIILVAILINYMAKEGGQCVKNPFIYGAGKMENVFCSCTQEMEFSCHAKFKFNDTTFISEVTKCDPKMEYMDITDLNLSLYLNPDS